MLVYLEGERETRYSKENDERQIANASNEIEKLMILVSYDWSNYFSHGPNCVLIIDHFHKWQRFCYSFVFMLIRPTGLVLVYTFF